MKKTTLHNHVHIGTNEKPLIPNIIYKILIDYAEKDDFITCDEILKLYTLEKFQTQLYEHKRFGKTFIK
jgi:spore cortex formation protein SpoVR/YcgB (stage V sporulation)